MHQKSDILARIAALESLSPSPSLSAEEFSAVRAAVEDFYTAPAGMADLVAETIHHVGMDRYYRETVYENQNLVPPFPPVASLAGYDDVRTLFDGNGVFAAMMDIADATFQEAFTMVAPEGGGESGSDAEGGTPTLTNPYLVEWAAAIPAAKASALSKLQVLSDACGNGTLNYGIAQMFEQLGQLVRMPEREEIAEKVYISGGFKELIQAYALDVLIPSYVEDV